LGTHSHLGRSWDTRPFGTHSHLGRTANWDTQPFGTQLGHTASWDTRSGGVHWDTTLAAVGVGGKGGGDGDTKGPDGYIYYLLLYKVCIASNLDLQ